ncbi:hypothetical protein BJ742DRAFT_388744 [Cladochytrium replicatum]|nr:hypothetical protein BJ742DRAFT_388744 [Cladochytrium replicatum]
MATTTTTTQNIRNWVSEVTQISAIVAVLDDAYTLLPSRRSGPPPSPLSPQQKLAQIGDVLAEVDPNVDRDAFLAPRTLSLPFTARSLLSHSAPKCDSKLVGILSDLIRREKEKESEKENGIYEWLVGEFAGVKETYEEQNEMWRVARGETEAIAKALEEMKREAEELVSVGNQARRELGVMMEKNDIEEQGSVCNQKPSQCHY